MPQTRRAGRPPEGRRRPRPQLPAPTPSTPGQPRDGDRLGAGMHAATERFALNGTFLNFNALDGADRRLRVRAGYGPNWDRLVEIKRRYDPLNIFRENNNIAP